MAKAHHDRSATSSPDGRFEFRGINHLALVCRDMERTVDFYSQRSGHAAHQDHRASRPAWASTSSSTAAAATPWPSSGSRTLPTGFPASRRRPADRTRGA